MISSSAGQSGIATQLSVDQHLPHLKKLQATLYGANADSEAKLILFPHSGLISYRLKVKGLDGMTAAFIDGPHGAIPLTTPNGRGDARGWVQVSSTHIEAIRANPSAYHIVIQSAAGDAIGPLSTR